MFARKYLYGCAKRWYKEFPTPRHLRTSQHLGKYQKRRLNVARHQVILGGGGNTTTLNGERERKEILYTPFRLKK